MNDVVLNDTGMATASKANYVLKVLKIALAILMIVLIIVEMAVMCMPYFHLRPKAVKRTEVLPFEDYSLQNYAWTDSEDMHKIFTDRDSRTRKPGEFYIKGYDSDYAVGIALVDVIGVVAIAFLLMNIKHSVSKHRYASAFVWKFLAHIACLIWCGYTTYTFMTNGILGAGYADYWVLPYTICLYLPMGAAVVAVVHAVLDFITRTRYKVIRVEK